MTPCSLHWRALQRRSSELERREVLAVLRCLQRDTDRAPDLDAGWISIQPMGQQRLDSASAEIAGMIAALGSTITKDGTFEAALQTVRENNLAVNQTFEGVPQEDLKE